MISKLAGHFRDSVLFDQDIVAVAHLRQGGVGLDDIFE
jgi:hypothetical protein